ncbi:MAG: hypothetical protein M0R80_01090 [Proteobacteria bacterium]|jgi:hypothetical protein|nr:hypothetical protein [Pseudomonadota bacterium]
MGCHRCEYVMFGAKFKYNEFETPDDDYELTEPYDDNAYQDKVTSCNGLTLVTDGMNGNYIYFGEVIAKAREESEGIEVSFEVETLQSVIGVKRIAIIAAIKKEAEKLGITLPPFDVGLHVFTHWH